MSRHRYEIRLRGRLTPTMASEFRQLDLESTTAPVDTVLEGTVEDDAGLHGLLRRIEGLGLELIEVHRLADNSGGATPGDRAGAPGYRSSN
ncbi:MAG TPA: hypothetical protein VL119_08430 [Acidimicrobiia bacterium]|nr:hypothetical protein [Acidimicrobiia bacterium]